MSGPCKGVPAVALVPDWHNVDRRHPDHKLTLCRCPAKGLQGRCFTPVPDLDLAALQSPNASVCRPTKTPWKLCQTRCRTPLTVSWFWIPVIQPQQDQCWGRACRAPSAPVPRALRCRRQRMQRQPLRTLQQRPQHAAQRRRQRRGYLSSGVSFTFSLAGADRLHMERQLARGEEARVAAAGAQPASAAPADGPAQMPATRAHARPGRGFSSATQSVRTGHTGRRQTSMVGVHAAAAAARRTTWASACGSAPVPAKNDLAKAKPHQALAPQHLQLCIAHYDQSKPERHSKCRSHWPIMPNAPKSLPQEPSEEGGPCMRTF